MFVELIGARAQVFRCALLMSTHGSALAHLAGTDTPMKNHFRLVTRVCACVFVCATSAAASTISVGAGVNLQAAINSAQPGDTIALQPGATFTGNFTLPFKGGDALITIRTAGDAGLPGDGGRISPANAGSLAKIRQGDGGPAIATAPGAHHWRLALLEIQGNGNSDIVRLVRILPLGTPVTIR